MEKIVFMGTPEFSAPILECLSHKFEIVLVVTQPDKEVGRKKVITYSPVKEKALELGLPVFQPVSLREDYEEIMKTDATILITAAYGQMVPVKCLNKFKYSINVHASLLPKYRGGAPIQRSIMNGDKVTGVSIIQMVKKMDAGVIYATSPYEIKSTDNNTILFKELSIIGCKLLMENIDSIISGNNQGIPQDEEKVVFANNISREEELIDFNDTSLNIHNKIRGLALNPGAYGIINDNTIKIYSSEIVQYQGNELPGTIIDLKKRVLVKTTDGAISLVEIKPSGKKEMKAIDFLNGQKIIMVNDRFN